MKCFGDSGMTRPPAKSGHKLFADSKHHVHQADMEEIEGGEEVTKVGALEGSRAV